MSSTNTTPHKTTFVGRRDRIEAFRDVLRKVFAQEEGTPRRSEEWDQFDPTAEYEDGATETDQPYIILVSGHGGIGKSHLLELFHIIAQRAQQDKQCLTLPIIRLEEGSRFSIRGRDNVEPREVLDVIQRALNRALPNELTAWQTARATIKTETGDIYEIDGMVALGNNIRQARHEYGSVQVHLGSERDRLPDPQERQRRKEQQFVALRDALGDDLRRISTSKPLIVFIDTYELVDIVDHFIRPLYTHSGKQIVWVIAGRNDLVPDRPGSANNEPFRGYESEKLVTNLVDMALKELTVDDITQLLEKEEVELKQNQIHELYNSTCGNALALNIAVSMLRKHQALEEILSSQETPLLRRLSSQAAIHGDNDLVYQMTNRLLLYCVNEQEKCTLYALALVHRPLFPLLKAMLQRDDIQTCLVDLERQYDFVSAQTKSLHDTVQYFLEKKLIEEMRDGSEKELITALCTRAQSFSLTVLQEQTTKLGTHLVSKLMADEEWSDALVDYLHYTLWLEPERATQEILAAYCCASRYRANLATRIRTIALDLQERADTKACPWLDAFMVWKDIDDPGEAHLTQVHTLIEQHNSNTIVWHPEPERAWSEVCAVLYAKQGEYYDPSSSHLGDAEKKDLKLAVKFYEKGMAAYSSMEWLLHRIGGSYYELQRWEDALDIYTLMIERYSDEHYINAAFNNRGAAFFNLCRYQDSLVDYDRALELQPDDPMVLANRGRAHHELGNYEQALADYTRALELRHDHPATLANRGRAHHELSNYEQALADYDRALELQPDDPVTLDNRGRAHHELGNYEQVLADYNRALALRPDDLRTLHNRGVTYAQMGAYEQALADYDRALALRPDDPIVLYARGLNYYQMGAYEQALADYDRALALRPDDPRTLNNRGLTYAQMGAYDRALADYDRALALQPDDPLMLTNRGVTYAQMGAYDRALADCNRALALQPDDPLMLANRGRAYREMGNYEQALVDYTRSLALQPDDPIVFYARGLTYAQMGAYDRALADCNRALALRPDDPIVLYNRGLIYFKMRDYRQALIDYTRSLILDLNVLVMLISRGLSTVRRGITDRR
ncbi:MAG: tetratricopeptide repeat protein [Chloroflexota bacterium]